MNDFAANDNFNADKTVNVQPIFISNSQYLTGYDARYRDNLKYNQKVAQQLWSEKAGIKLNFLGEKTYKDEKAFNNFNFGDRNFRNAISEKTSQNAINIIFTNKIEGNKETLVPKWTVFNNVKGSAVAVNAHAINNRADALSHAIGRGMGLKEKGFYSPIHKERVFDSPRNLMTEANERKVYLDLVDARKQGLSTLTRGQINKARNSSLVRDISPTQRFYQDRNLSGEMLKESQVKQRQIDKNLNQAQQKLTQQQPRLVTLESKVERISQSRVELSQQKATLNDNAQKAGLNRNQAVNPPSPTTKTPTIKDNQHISKKSPESPKNSVDRRPKL